MTRVAHERPRIRGRSTILPTFGVVRAAAVVTLLWSVAAAPAPAADPPKPAPSGYPVVDPEPTPQPGPQAAVPAALAKIIWLLPNDKEFQAGSRMNARLPDELLRQALWLTAREEFGLRVGDESLNEAVPAGLPTDRQFRIRGDHEISRPANVPPVYAADKAFGWTILQGAKPGEHAIWQGNALFDYYQGGDQLGRQIEEAERLTRGLFPKLLTAAGFQRRAIRTSDAAVPAEAEKLLETLRETDTFAALRLLHAEVEKQGESPALLAALSRGYANLALLTDYFWTANAAIFKARSLLYAQRLVARLPGSATAIWVRGYANACVGLHAYAMDDLAAAAKAARAQPKAPQPRPAWLDVIDTYLHFDHDRMKVLQEKNPTPLGRLFQFLIIEAPYGDVGVKAAINAGRAYLAVNPEGYRVHDSLCRTGGVSHLHDATAAGPKAFAEHFRQRLQETPGLPEAVLKTLADDGVGPAEVYRSLREAGSPAADAGVPSWSALASVLQDVQFAQAMHQLDFAARKLAVGTADAAGEWAKPLAGHPLFPVVEAFQFDPLREPKKVAERLKAVPAARLPLWSLAYYFALRRVDVAASDDWYYLAPTRADVTYEARAMVVRTTPRTAEGKPISFDLLAPASPHSPLAVGQSINHAGAEDVANFPAYEVSYSSQPVVLQALALYHSTAGRTAEAIKFWERWIEVSPEWDAYRNLAVAYRKLGRPEAWEKTLVASLAEEDVGLNHAQANEMLARGFLAAKQPEKAERYAEAAAESGAAWAMLCAAECKAVLKKWDEAEQFYQSAARRYGHPAFEWYFLARQTGKLNAAAAEEAVRTFLEGLADPPPPAWAFQVARFHLLTQRPKKAQALFARMAAAPQPPDLPVLFATLLADARGETAARDGAMALRPKLRKESIEAPTLDLLAGWYKAAAVPDAEAVEKAVAALPAVSRPDAEFFVGWYLANRGEAKRAEAHWLKYFAANGHTASLQAHAVIFLADVRRAGKLDLTTEKAD